MISILNIGVQNINFIIIINYCKIMENNSTDMNITDDQESQIWQEIKQDYEILKLLGTGAFGQVIKAKHKITNQIVSIKLIKECFENTHRIRMLLRELMILRKLSEMEDNIFTTKLYDVILP